MVLKKISLHNFRNAQSRIVEFDPHLTLILGPNSHGKTNLLEAVHVITNGAGFRETKEYELINFKHNDQASVEAIFSNGDDASHAKIILVPREDTVAKSYFINKTKRTVRDYIREMTRSVLFAPQQIEILTGAPELRRQYMNRLLCIYDYEYKTRLDNYENALRKRNKILESVHDIFKLRSELAFWDTYLIEQADYITSARSRYMAFLVEDPSLMNKKLNIEYISNPMTASRLAEKFELEMRTKRTMIGPQKDDFIITLENKNVHRFGSRSEQRLAILWLKFAEIRMSVEKLGRQPMLLLDDVFSEFDESNKRLVLELLKNYQTIATTTEEELIEATDIPTTVVSL